MKRIIVRMDVKPPNLVKGIHLEGFRVMGDPIAKAHAYYEQGADEIAYQDVVASLYQRNSLLDLVTSTASSAFIPLTLGGGLRSVHDVQAGLRAGADKVSVNTAAIADPRLISDLATHFGSQAVVVSIEAKRHNGGWLAMTDSGREHTGRDAVDWAAEAARRGAGEISLTSIDREGTRAGMDIDLIKRVRAAVEVPLVAHGGVGSVEHVRDAFGAGADAVALASVLHYGDLTVRELKRALRPEFEVRS